jgi:hypothetical protein
MSQFLARIARTLSFHWKRSLAAAVGVLVLLVLAAGVAGDATDDFSLPGAESSKRSRSLPGAFAAFGGVDSTLVCTVDSGKSSDRLWAAGGASIARSPRSATWTYRRTRPCPEPVEQSGPAVSDGSPCGAETCAIHRPGGHARSQTARSRMSRAQPRPPTPVVRVECDARVAGATWRPRRAARRRADRELPVGIAIVFVTLLFARGRRWRDAHRAPRIRLRPRAADSLRRLPTPTPA